VHEGVATSLATEDAALPIKRNAWPRASKALPASRHELLLHLAVGGDRWWWTGNVAGRRVDNGDSVTNALG
jgi:hypothetical protein